MTVPDNLLIQTACRDHYSGYNWRLVLAGALLASIFSPQLVRISGTLRSTILFSHPQHTGGAGKSASNLVNVRDFGARGDGISDDTSAFNRAYEQLSMTGGTILVPRSSHCYLATEIIRRSGVTLSGQGAESTCIKNLPVPGLSVPLLSVPHNPDPVEHETIQNLTLDGSRDKQADIHLDGDSDCVFLRGYSQTTLRNLVIRDCYTDGIYVVGAGVSKDINGSNLLIDHVRVTNSRRNNLSIISGDNITITASLFANAQGTAPESGIDIEPDLPSQSIHHIVISKDVTLADNYGSGLSLFNQFSDQPSMDVTINGSFLRNRTNAVNILSSKPFQVGAISISGTMTGNGPKTGVGVGLQDVHDISIPAAKVSQKGIALWLKDGVNVNLGVETRLDGTIYDLFVAGESRGIRVPNRKTLAHSRIGGAKQSIAVR
jgi:hypothetical protein